MLNEEFILKCIEPHLNENRELSQLEFLELFSGLDLHEQYEVIDIMIKNNIDYVDEKAEETKVLEQAGILRQNEAEKDLKRLMYLTNEQLCVMAQNGESAALAALLEKNKRFVYKVAYKLYGQFKQTNLSLDDLYQEGNIGFIEGIKRFDSSRDIKLITYAWYWIRQQITRSAVDKGYLIRIPSHLYEKILKLNSCRRKNPYADIKEIMEIYNVENNSSINHEEVIRLIKLEEQYLNTASLNSLVGEDENTELMDFIADEDMFSVEDAAVLSSMSKDIEAVLYTLQPREEKILRMHFGFEDGKKYSLSEISSLFNITQERVRQIEARAIRKLRHPSRAKILKSYYEGK